MPEIIIFLNSLSFHIIFQFPYGIGCHKYRFPTFQDPIARKSRRTSPSFRGNFIGILPIVHPSDQILLSSVHCSMSRRHNCLFRNPSIMSPPDRFRNIARRIPYEILRAEPPAGAPGLTFTINTISFHPYSLPLKEKDRDIPTHLHESLPFSEFAAVSPIDAIR